MKNKMFNLILICVLVAFLLLAGCTEETDTTNQTNNKDNSEDSNQDNPTDNTTILATPIYPDMTKSLFYNESFWEETNVDSDLTKEMYQSNSSIETIISWYENTDNLNDWTIKSTKLIGDNDTLVVAKGEVFLQHETESIFIACLVSKDTSINAETIIGIARGNWTLVNNSGFKD